MRNRAARYADERNMVLEKLSELLDSSDHAFFSTRDIADEAGLQQSLIFRYFRDREDLVNAVAEKWSLEMNLQTSEYVEPETRLMAHLSWALSHSNRMRFLIVEHLKSPRGSGLASPFKILMPNSELSLNAIGEQISDESDPARKLHAATVFGVGWLLANSFVTDLLSDTDEVDSMSPEFVWEGMLALTAEQSGASDTRVWISLD